MTPPGKLDRDGPYIGQTLMIDLVGEIGAFTGMHDDEQSPPPGKHSETKLYRL